MPEHDRTLDSPTDSSFVGDETTADRPRADAAVDVGGGTKVGPYVVVETIGAGAMGVVYAAYDPRLERQVAIKMVRANPGEASKGAPRLFREAQALAKLSHPNVVPVFDVGEHDGGVFLAMEFVRGEDFRHWLSRGGRTWREILAIMIDAGRGLAAAHAAGIVHRDFKPDNVLLDASGRARVTDFGLARGHGEADAPPSVALDSHDSLSATLTRTGSVVGTPSYMAPEQHVGRPVDARADQYAFCVTLYEALYEERPFIGLDLQDLANRKWSETFASNVSVEMRRGVPPDLLAVIKRGLKRDPAARFEDMNALCDALARLTARKANRRAAILGATAFAGIAAGIAYMMRVDPCPDGRGLLADVWDDPRRERISTAFERSATKVAVDTWPRVEGALDTWASSWVDAHAQICTAALAKARVDPELDAGMLCLRQARARAGGVLDVLEEGTRDAVHSADALLATLTDPHACHDATARVEEPQVTRERQRLREAIDVADVRIDAAQYGVARELAGRTEEDARALGLADLELEARLLRAVANVRSGRYPAAEDGFTSVFWEAEANGLDELALRAATRLVFLLAEPVDRPADGLLWLRHAEALLVRLGEGDTLARAKLLENAGSLYDALLQEEHGETLLRQALAIRLRLQPDDAAAVSTVRNNLALRLGDRGAFEEALALHRVALENRIARLGPYHPDVAMSLINQAKPLIALDRETEALDRLAEAEPIVRASLGNDHPMLDAIQIARAAALMDLGQLDAARIYLQLALAAAMVRTGPDSRSVGHIWNIFAVSYQYQHDAVRARMFFDRARDTFVALGPDGELGAAYVASNRSQLELVEGDLDAAKALMEEAYAAFTRIRRPGHPELVHAMTHRAQIELARGELAATRRTLDEAAAIHVPGIAGEMRTDIIASIRLRLDATESGSTPEAEAQGMVLRERIARQDPHSVEVILIDRWLESLRLAKAQPPRTKPRLTRGSASP